MTTSANVTRFLAEVVVGAVDLATEPELMSRLKIGILDSVGIALFAYDLVDAPLVRYAETIAGPAHATVLGAGTRTGCGLAAGVNAQMASDSDFEETGPGVHMLPTLVATALAVGEYARSSGRDVMEAVAMAYDINERFARAQKDGARVFSVYGGHARRHLYLLQAAVAARLLGLDVDRANGALGLSWLVATPPRLEDAFGVGHENAYRGSPHLTAGELGVRCALLAHQRQDGGTTPDVLEQLAGDDYDLEELLVVGDTHPIVSRMCLKTRIGSWGFQGGLELVHRLRTRHDIDPFSIRSIQFRGPELYVPFATAKPRDFWQAQGSVPWAIANTLLEVPVGAAWVSDLGDERRRALARKVTVGVSPSPEHNIVAVETADGAIEEWISRSEFPGAPSAFGNSDRWESKFLATAASVLTYERCVAALDRLRDLDRVASVREVMELLVAPAPANSTSS